MEDYVLSNAGSAAFRGAPPLDTSFGTADAKLVLLPPGAIDIKVVAENPIFDVNLAQSKHRISCNSDRLEEKVVASESLAYFAKDNEVRVQTNNPLPGCIVEVTETALSQWLEDHGIDGTFRCDKVEYRGDRVAAHVGRSAIRFLRNDPDNAPQNRMTIEALALGVAARAVALFAAKDGDVDEEINAWKRRGDLSRIRRAVDWAEGYLLEPTLSVSDMATAAGLSSCHFGVVFKTHMGESPYSYVLRRRAEFARDLIEGTDEPIAQIAFAAGFSSQAHLTTVMRRVLGVTPGKLRTRA